MKIPMLDAKWTGAVMPWRKIDERSARRGLPIEGGYHRFLAGAVFGLTDGPVDLDRLFR